MPYTTQTHTRTHMSERIPVEDLFSTIQIRVYSFIDSISFYSISCSVFYYFSGRTICWTQSAATIYTLRWRTNKRTKEQMKKKIKKTLFLFTPTMAVSICLRKQWREWNKFNERCMYILLWFWVLRKLQIRRNAWFDTAAARCTFLFHYFNNFFFFNFISSDLCCSFWPNNRWCDRSWPMHQKNCLIGSLLLSQLTKLLSLHRSQRKWKRWTKSKHFV